MSLETHTDKQVHLILSIFKNDIQYITTTKQNKKLWGSETQKKRNIKRKIKRHQSEEKRSKPRESKIYFYSFFPSSTSIFLPLFYFFLL
jgi:predicted membrane chloride channel (bestrophin family)